MTRRKKVKPFTVEEIDALEITASSYPRPNITQQIPVINLSPVKKYNNDNSIQNSPLCPSPSSYSLCSPSPSTKFSIQDDEVEDEDEENGKEENIDDEHLPSGCFAVYVENKRKNSKNRIRSLKQLVPSPIKKVQLSEVGLGLLSPIPSIVGKPASLSPSRSSSNVFINDKFSLKRLNIQKKIDEIEKEQSLTNPSLNLKYETSQQKFGQHKILPNIVNK